MIGWCHHRCSQSVLYHRSWDGTRRRYVSMHLRNPKCHTRLDGFWLLPFYWRHLISDVSSYSSVRMTSSHGRRRSKNGFWGASVVSFQKRLQESKQTSLTWISSVGQLFRKRNQKTDALLQHVWESWGLFSFPSTSNGGLIRLTLKSPAFSSCSSVFKSHPCAFIWIQSLEMISHHDSDFILPLIPKNWTKFPPLKSCFQSFCLWYSLWSSHTLQPQPMNPLVFESNVNQVHRLSHHTMNSNNRRPGSWVTLATWVLMFAKQRVNERNAAQKRSVSVKGKMFAATWIRRTKRMKYLSWTTGKDLVATMTKALHVIEGQVRHQQMLVASRQMRSQDWKYPMLQPMDVGKEMYPSLWP